MTIRLREIKQRIAGTRQIHKVTDTLQRIAAARLAESRRTTASSREYTERLAQVVREVLSCSSDSLHPLATWGRSDTVVLVVFGSDRGLCGGYNGRLMDSIHAFMAKQSPDNVRLLILGKTINRRSRKHGYHVAQNLPHPPIHQRSAVLDAIARDIMDAFLRGRAGQVHVLYMKFVTGLEQIPVIERVLPVSIDIQASFKPAFRGASLEPAPREMLSRLLPEYVQQTIDHAYLNSVSSENAARQTAMNRAAENADKILTEQTKIYRRLRQESITTEMMELAGGRAE